MILWVILPLILVLEIVLKALFCNLLTLLNSFYMLHFTMATHNANEYVRENSTKLLSYCMEDSS